MWDRLEKYTFAIAGGHLLPSSHDQKELPLRKSNLILTIYEHKIVPGKYLSQLKMCKSQPKGYSAECWYRPSLSGG